MTFGSCSILNSSVASRPAYSRIAFSPPGWSGRNFVTSSTCPSTITQMSSFLLCLATSSFVYSPLEGEGAGDGAGAAVGAGVDSVDAGAGAGAGEEVEGAGVEEEEDEGAPSAHENERLTFAWLGSIVIVVLNGCPPRCPATAPRRPFAFSAAAAFCSKYAAALSPATRPNTTHPNNDEPPRRFAPCTPPATSPAANNPGMGLLPGARTRDSGSISSPPIV